MNEHQSQAHWGASPILKQRNPGPESSCKPELSRVGPVGATKLGIPAAGIHFNGGRQESTFPTKDNPALCQTFGLEKGSVPFGDVQHEGRTACACAGSKGWRLVSHPQHVCTNTAVDCECGQLQRNQHKWMARTKGFDICAVLGNHLLCLLSSRPVVTENQFGAKNKQRANFPTSVGPFPLTNKKWNMHACIWDLVGTGRYQNLSTPDHSESVGFCVMPLQTRRKLLVDS